MCYKYNTCKQINVAGERAHEALKKHVSESLYCTETLLLSAVIYTVCSCICHFSEFSFSFSCIVISLYVYLQCMKCSNFICNFTVVHLFFLFYLWLLLNWVCWALLMIRVEMWQKSSWVLALHRVPCIKFFFVLFCFIIFHIISPTNLKSIYKTTDLTTPLSTIQLGQFRDQMPESFCCSKDCDPLHSLIHILLHPVCEAFRAGLGVKPPQ